MIGKNAAKIHMRLVVSVMSTKVKEVNQPFNNSNLLIKYLFSINPAIAQTIPMIITTPYPFIFFPVAAARAYTPNIIGT